MRKRTATSLVLALVLAGLVFVPRAAAQESARGSETQAKPSDSYRIEFTVNEMDNGKKINSRSYSMQIRAETVPKWTDWKRLRVGSQVPIAGEGGIQYTYRDVGMQIDCRLMPLVEGKVAVATTWDYSSLGAGPGTDAPHPVIRHVRSEVEATVPLDKPTVISEVDDVASTRRYVFEVKAAKINP